MNTNQIEALTGMTATLGLLLLMALPSLIGIARDRRADRQIREARRIREAGQISEARQIRERDQKSSSKPTEPSTATWYAEGRRSKKLVSS